MENQTKLPEDFKAKWVAALRSGEYKQGKNTLISINEDKGNTYCCLGVACAIKGIAESLMIRFTAIAKPYCKGDNTFADLPDMIKSGTRASSILICMNDGTGVDGKAYSFAEIAEYIETNL